MSVLFMLLSDPHSKRFKIVGGCARRTRTYKLGVPMLRSPYFARAGKRGP